MAAPMPGRCGFFVEKKKRFCKMIVARGKKYCGEHATMEGGVSRRIVCPLDPKHTVSEDKLEKHLKKCNSREKPKPVYYVENINAGPADGEDSTPQVSLSELSRSQLESLVDKLKEGVKGFDCHVEDMVLSHSVVQEELNNPKNGVSAHKHLKQQSSILGHLEAQGLLGRGRCFIEFGAGRGKLSHWIHEALRTPEHLQIQDHQKTLDPQKKPDDLQMLLVERCSTRFKVDGKHQDSGVQFERLQVDIQHLDLSRVQMLRLKKLPLVGVGKHLCGAATDLALRCLLETSGHTDETEPPPKRLKTSEPEPTDLDDSGALQTVGADSGPKSDCPCPGPESETPSPVPDSDSSGPGPVLGLAVALCCHHRCEWRHYVGQQFFQERGLGAEEFSAFCRMSSWATCGLRLTNQEPQTQNIAKQKEEDDEHEPTEETDAVNSFLSSSERERIGLLCKRLIDGGRLHFLKTRGFDGKLCRYMDAKVTLENVLLTAIPSSLS